MSPILKERIYISSITLLFLFLLVFIGSLELYYSVSTNKLSNGLTYSFYNEDVVQVVLSGSLISAFFYPMILTGVAILMLIVNQNWKRVQTKMTLYSVLSFALLFIYMINSEAFIWFID